MPSRTPQEKIGWRREARRQPKNIASVLQIVDYIPSDAL